MYETVIYIDLDGVLVDLHSGIVELTGGPLPKERTPENKIKVEALWDTIAKEHPRFWLDLKPLPYAMQLYTEVLKIDPFPFILSATPENYTGSDDSSCRQQKMAWVHKNIDPTLLHRTIITKSKLKQEQIGKSPRARRKVLIDDHPGNIARWNDAGGYGIMHTSIETTLKAIERLK
jgi:hypothetical protein